MGFGSYARHAETQLTHVNEIENIYTRLGKYKLINVLFLSEIFSLQHIIFGQSTCFVVRRYHVYREN